MHSRSPTFVSHHHGPLLSPVLSPTHLCLTCSRVSCPPHCLPHVFPTSFGPGWVLPPHVGLSPVHPAYLAMSPPLVHPAHLIGSLSDPSPCICLSPVHLAHLPMSPPCILPTLLATSCV